MASLEWIRARDGVWLPPGAPLQFGKTVILRGTGYTHTEPDEFVMYRVPTKLVSWALDSQSKKTKWEHARRPIEHRYAKPIPTVDTGLAVLAPGGFFHTHRWQFGDRFGNWSPVVRTTRFSTLRASLRGGVEGVDAGVDVTVATTVDPRIRVELSLPWEPRVVSPRDAINNELLDLQTLGEIESPSDVMAPLDGLFPEARPDGVEFSAEPVEYDLEEGALRVFETPISGLGAEPFAFCFVGTNLDSDDVTTSEVVVVGRNEEGGLLGFGFEGVPLLL